MSSVAARPAPDLSAAAHWRASRGRGFPAGRWSVDDGRLRAHAAGPPVSLTSRSRFLDFDLSFEWKLAPAANSGVFYRVSETLEAPWQSGAEMQLVDAAHADSRVPETSCGALYGLYAPASSPGVRAGAFNTGRIRVRRSRVEHWLNGARVLACDLASDEFRARVAHSRFRDFPAFARSPEGHIVLQHHGSDAWFRNVRIAPG